MKSKKDSFELKKLQRCNFDRSKTIKKQSYDSLFEWEYETDEIEDSIVFL